MTPHNSTDPKDRTDDSNGEGWDRFPPKDKTPDVDPNVTVVEVRGSKRVGFDGLKHLDMPPEERDRIHDVYTDIIIDLDDVKHAYDGADRAWHIGRILDEYDIQNNQDMTLQELGAFNTIDDMYARRLFYARYIYEFWPDQQYDPRHSVTALGELASRATNNDRITEAQNGYARLLDNDEPLTKPDVIIWDNLGTDATMHQLAAATADKYETPVSVGDAVKRILLLLDRTLSSVSKSEVQTAIWDATKQ